MDGTREGLIFDVKKYSINDGPGIRTTVFFKGCPLSCRWCHNPEGQSSAPEIMVRASRCLADCRECVSVCPEKAVGKPALVPVLDRSKCNLCGKCAEVCPAQAVQVVGRRITASELLLEIESDRIFQEESGGGVTFSGGEPLSQPEFLIEILDLCRKKEIHTTVDTCGFAAAEVLDRIAPKTDLFLYDLKVMDDQKHAAFTGVSNRKVLENLRRLAATGHKTVVRIPVIPGVNDDQENVRLAAEFLRSLGTIGDISLLPYHKMGLEKYGGLDKKGGGDVFLPPSNETMQRIKSALEGYGFRVSLGE
jgi:pyruvate formate lyase activating enzyme